MPSPVNILLVDDRPSNLLALRAVLEPLGENLLEASSGEAALRLAAQHDLAAVVLDVQMPGMDGFETAARLRGLDRARETPIVFLTAVAVREDQVARGYALGAVDYMLKPFTPEILRAKIETFAESFRHTRSLELRLKQARPPDEQIKILVVNDDPVMRAFIASAVSDLQAHVLTAGSARETLALLLQQEVGFILLDMHMPEMSGLEAVKIIKQNERFRKIPVLFVTATDQAEKDVQSAYEVGALDFVFLPIKPELLRAKVQAYLNQCRQRHLLEQHLGEIERLNAAVTTSEKELRLLNATLEQRVQEQTRALEEAADALGRQNEALRASEEQYRRLVDTAEQGIWVVDENDLIVFVNPRMTEILGYTAAEMLDRHPLDFVTEKMRPIGAEHFAEHRKGAKLRFESEYVHKGGGTVYVLGSAVPLMKADGTYGGSFAMISDISSRKQAETDLQRLNERLQSIRASQERDGPRCSV